MNIIFNELENFINIKKKYYEFFEKECKNPLKDVLVKLVNERYINKCREIIQKELKEKDHNAMVIKSYFENPYHIYIWDEGENKYNNEIQWEENIFNISTGKLCEILKKNNKRYLLMDGTYSVCFPYQKIVEIENLDKDSIIK